MRARTERNMRGTDPSVIERPYDGCGTCLLGVRRLSRVKLATSSPERQRENVLTAAASVGAHISYRVDYQGACPDRSGTVAVAVRPGRRGTGYAGDAGGVLV